MPKPKPKREDWQGKYEKAVHFIRCAQANFENVLRLNPQLRDIPVIAMISKQVEWALEDASPKKRKK